MGDPRRAVPRTDAVLDDARLADPLGRLGRDRVRSVVREVQDEVRAGRIEPGDVVSRVLDALPPGHSSLRPVINATGVLLHTNLGRAPLSDAALAAVAGAGGSTDVELDLDTGRRAPRGRGALEALQRAVPAAEAVHVVNNGAAALMLAATALAAGREIVVSRGELVEIGDGFRIPELLESTGATVVEVGTTNRTTLGDYEKAVGPDTALVLKVHPSNFVVTGFTASVDVRSLAALRVPLVVDIGSGLLHPEPLLPEEPDATTVLRAGADLVTASGDKLLGGPQAGLLLGRRALVDALRRHPVARAVRVDKLTLAALEATLAGPPNPTRVALAATAEALHERAARLADGLRRAGVEAVAVDSEGRVGGGGAPGVRLPGAAVGLPAAYADSLRRGSPPVLGRVEQGRLLLDLRAVPADLDAELHAAVVRAAHDLAG